MDTHELLHPWSKNRVESQFQPRPWSNRGICYGLWWAWNCYLFIFLPCVAEINQAPL